MVLAGWTYDNESWKVDLHCPGDAEGWIYATKENNFWKESSTFDTTER